MLKTPDETYIILSHINVSSFTINSSRNAVPIYILPNLAPRSSLLSVFKALVDETPSKLFELLVNVFFLLKFERDKISISNPRRHRYIVG